MGSKILFFCGGAYISGMEIVTLHLMKGLKENGYEVRCIFSGWNDGNFKNKLDEIGIVNYEIKIGWIYIRKPLWTMDTFINYPRALHKCHKIIKEFKPDVSQFVNFSFIGERIIDKARIKKIESEFNFVRKEFFMF